jgi:hypothetical protein
MNSNSDRAYFSWYKLDEDQKHCFAVLRLAGLSVRAAGALARVGPGYESRENIRAAYKSKRLLRFRNIGLVTYKEIGRWLDEKEPGVCPYCHRSL